MLGNGIIGEHLLAASLQYCNVLFVNFAISMKYTSSKKRDFKGFFFF